MAKILVIGATGETGRRTVQQLAGVGHKVLGLYRRPEQARELERLGAEPVLGDLVTATVESLAAFTQGIDAVIFTAGSGDGGDDLTDKIDGDGVRLAAEAARFHGVKRFLLVSVFPDAWRERRMPPDFEHYMAVKRRADVYLTSTDLDWVIVRPGTLTTEQPKGVRIGLAIPYGDVSRDSLARTLVALIDTPSVNRVILELTDGSDQVGHALAPFAQVR
jgi:uncharacterized protein YbjT (DUF2867 family)